MNIYHLSVKDQDDHQFDIDYHFSHSSKGATNLYEDFYTAYEVVEKTMTDWNIVDILSQLENMGWTKVEIVTVDVYY
jgi:hypothetical protein